MKKNSFLILLLLCSLSIMNAQNLNSSDAIPGLSYGNAYRNEAAQLVSPWTAEIGYTYNMSVYAQVFKDNVLFIPTGLVLGVFKDGICHGQVGLSKSPAAGGKGFVLTMGNNRDADTGFTYKAYDPTSGEIYDISQTLDFKSLSIVGAINAPVKLNISGASAINVSSNSSFRIYPNPVEDRFAIMVGDVEISSHAVIGLYNVSGQLEKILFNGDMSSNQSIVIERDRRLTKGVYFVKAIVGTKEYVQKLIMK